MDVGALVVDIDEGLCLMWVHRLSGLMLLVFGAGAGVDAAAVYDVGIAVCADVKVCIGLGVGIHVGDVEVDDDYVDCVAAGAVVVVGEDTAVCVVDDVGIDVDPIVVVGIGEDASVVVECGVNNAAIDVRGA